MATGVDAALAKAGRVCDLGTDPSQFLDKFEEWYEEHKLLADSISSIRGSEAKSATAMGWPRVQEVCKERWGGT